MSGIAFGSGNFGVLFVAAAVSVYAFDAYERAWGKGGSVQVLWMLAIAFSLAASLAFAAALRLRRRKPTRTEAVLLGGAVALVFVLYASVAKSLPSILQSAPVFFLFMPVAAALSSFATRRRQNAV